VTLVSPPLILLAVLALRMLLGLIFFPAEDLLYLRFWARAALTLPLLLVLGLPLALAYPSLGPHIRTRQAQGGVG